MHLIEGGSLLMGTDFSKLTREIQTLPSYIEKALNDNDVFDDYLNRPAYQQNDYISWIERAKREDTKKKRLSQMIEELRVGGVYMKMEHKASQK